MTTELIIVSWNYDWSPGMAVYRNDEAGISAMFDEIENDFDLFDEQDDEEYEGDTASEDDEDELEALDERDDEPTISVRRDSPEYWERFDQAYDGSKFKSYDIQILDTETLKLRDWPR